MTVSVPVAVPEGWQQLRARGERPRQRNEPLRRELPEARARPGTGGLRHFLAGQPLTETRGHRIELRKGGLAARCVAGAVFSHQALNQIRSFQDRGTWRFRVQDIQELARQRGAGSEPELPLSQAPVPPPAPAPGPRTPASKRYRLAPSRVYSRDPVAAA